MTRQRAKNDPIPCRSCGTLIRFEPTERGGYRPVRADTGANHFDDCPGAAEFRKQRQMGANQGTQQQAQQKRASAEDVGLRRYHCTEPNCGLRFYLRARDAEIMALWNAALCPKCGIVAKHEAKPSTTQRKTTRQA